MFQSRFVARAGKALGHTFPRAADEPFTGVGIAAGATDSQGRTASDLSLYYGTLARGVPWAGLAYLLLVLPPYPPINWLRMAASTVLFAAIVLVALVASRRAEVGDQAAQRRRLRIAIQSQTVLGCAAIANEMAGIEHIQGSLIPLLFIIVVCNGAFQRGWDLAFTWLITAATHLVGLLLADESTWLAISSTVIFASATLAVLASLQFIMSYVRRLNRDLDLERSVAADAAMFSDRDAALRRMLPASAKLLRVPTLAITRTTPLGSRIMVSGDVDGQSPGGIERFDLAAGRVFEGVADGEATIRLCWPLGETPDPRQVDGVCALVRPVLERALHVDRLEGLAHSDGLTGLANRRRLDHTFDRLAESEFGLLLIDLDRFKALNDTLGHAAGDATIVSAADLIRSVAREDDLAARYGGEEFCIVVPQATLRTVRAMERRLRAAWDRANLPVTFSAGIAVRVDGESPAMTFRRADSALYRAKREGRGMAVVADTP